MQSYSHIPRRLYDKGSERAAADSDPISVLAEKATSDMFGIPQILQRAQVPMLESNKHVWSEFWVCLVNGLMVTNPPLNNLEPMWKLPNLATRRQCLWNFEMYKTYFSLSHCSCKQWWSLIIMTMMKRQRKETCLIVPLVRLSVPLSPHSWGTRGKHAAGAGNKPWMLRARNIQPGHYMLFMLFMWVFVIFF